MFNIYIEQLRANWIWAQNRIERLQFEIERLNKELLEARSKP